MTIGDLLNNLARLSDDDSDTFRISARTWLNLVRSHMAERARWRGAVRIDTFATAAATTDGIYTLTRYAKLVEDTLYDETNIQPIQHESHAPCSAIAPPDRVASPPLSYVIT